METAKAELYLKSNCANSDRIARFADEHRVPVAKKYVDADPRFKDELTSGCGCASMDVPCMKEGSRWFRSPDEIMSELERLGPQ